MGVPSRSQPKLFLLCDDAGSRMAPCQLQLPCKLDVGSQIEEGQSSRLCYQVGMIVIAIGIGISNMFVVIVKRSRAGNPKVVSHKITVPVQLDPGTDPTFNTMIVSSSYDASVVNVFSINGTAAYPTSNYALVNFLTGTFEPNFYSPNLKKNKLQ